MEIPVHQKYLMMLTFNDQQKLYSKCSNSFWINRKWQKNVKKKKIKSCILKNYVNKIYSF